MHNLDTFLPAFLFITRFAESYSEGTYGSGAYNETGSTSPIQPTTPNTVTQANDVTPVDSDQPVNSTNNRPQTTISQPVTRQNDIAPEAVSILGMDPITLTYGALITLAILVTVGALIAKKITRQ